MSFSSLLERVQHRASAVEIVYASHDRWPLSRTPHPDDTDTDLDSSSSQVIIDSDRLRIAVLDSSFNPPTNAHLALALSSFPNGTEHGEAEETAEIAERPGERRKGNGAYTARLLLLSVRNADKQLKTGDATYAQRLEMMVRLAQVMESSSSTYSSTSTQGPVDLSATNVAVAIIDEPTFVRKSDVLLTHLSTRLASLTESESDGTGIHSPASPTTPPRPQLTFILGLDTLERLLAPRYYPPLTPTSQQPPSGAVPPGTVESMKAALKVFFDELPAGQGSRVAWANRRSDGPTGPRTGEPPKDDAHEEKRKVQALLEPVAEFVRRGLIAMIDDFPLDLQIVSSTGVRRCVRESGGRIDDDDMRGLEGMVPQCILDFIREEGLHVVNE